MLSNPLFLIQYFGYATFFVEIFVLEMVLMRHFEKRPAFWYRLSGLLVLSPVTVFIPELNIGVFNMTYLVICALCICSAWFLFKVKFRSCCFYTLSAWAAQHTAWSIVLIFSILVAISDVAMAFVYIGIYLAVYLAVFFGFSFRRKDYEVSGDNTAVIIVSFLVLFLTVFLYDLVGEYDNHTVYYSVYSVIACVLVLFVQYGFTQKESVLRKSIELEVGNKTLQDMLVNQSKQQKIASDTVDIINYKCHDLKHQIGTLRKVMKSEDGNKYLDELEDAVMIYSNIAKTGNDALDVILTEKALLCEGHEIKLTYMTDGEGLNFMNPTDISALFGNMLDNAIGSTKEEDPGKRFIRMNIARMAGYVRIHCENYCSHPVQFEDGLPISPNAASGLHGFGSKSMRYIAQRYGGKVYMRTQDELFISEIVIPEGHKAEALAQPKAGMRKISDPLRP
ncbi:MAG: ATP-binding protein [Clostridia bacterium]|nr:ATP-binding protein [Clostridia bacterium]